MELGDPIAGRLGHGRRGTDLAVRLAGIERGLGIDDQFVPRSQQDVDRLHAYRLLAHAEVEEFIEQLASMATDVTSAQAMNGVLTHAGHHLVVAWAIGRLRLDAAKARYPDYRSADAVAKLAVGSADLTSAVTSHRERIKNNNGLKEANVRQLLLPLGFRESHFAPGLLNQLTAFGELRGAVAHATGMIGVAAWPTGSSEIGRTAALLPGLKQLEQVLPVLLHPV